MFKEITLKASFSYTDEDFRTTVEKFKAGMTGVKVYQ